MSIKVEVVKKKNHMCESLINEQLKIESFSKRSERTVSISSSSYTTLFCPWKVYFIVGIERWKSRGTNEARTCVEKVFVLVQYVDTPSNKSKIHFEKLNCWLSSQINSFFPVSIEQIFFTVRHNLALYRKNADEKVQSKHFCPSSRQFRCADWNK